MSRKALLFLVFLFFVTTLYAQQRSAEDALELASRFLKVPTSRLDAVSSQPAAARGTQTAGMGVPQGYYIINDTVGNRFIIVSADERMHTILGYSDCGTFVAEQAPDGLQDLLKSYDNTYAWLADNVTMTAARQKVTYTEVSPLLKTTWGQGQTELPYNLLCPDDPYGSGNKCKTGCVATVMAQVMNYYRYPAQGLGEHSYTPNGFAAPLALDFSSIQFDWNNMPEVELEWNSSNQTQINAVAQLMYACGVAVEMNYGIGGSNAIEGNIPYALINYFGYNPNMLVLKRDKLTSAEWNTIIQEELQAQRPVIYSGQGPQGGHEFIIDGCNEDGYHVNWGWYGVCNGYFQLDGMDTGDQETFNDQQYMITGICPEKTGKPGDVFLTDGFYMTYQDVAVGETCYQIGIYRITCNSTKTNYYKENQASINATACVALYDTDWNFVRELAASVSRSYYFYVYWKTDPTFSFTLDSETFRDGTTYYVVPCVRNDDDQTYTPLYTRYGRTNYYIATTKEGRVSFKLKPVDQVPGATGSGTLEDPYNIAAVLNLARNSYNGLNSKTSQNIYVRGKVSDYSTWYRYNLCSDDTQDVLVLNDCRYIDGTSWIEGDPEIKEGDDMLVCCSVYCEDGMTVTISDAYVVLHNGSKERGRGTQYNPYSVSEARTLCQEYYDYAGNNNRFSCVRGYVVSIEEVSTKYGNCSFHLAETRGATTDLLKVYRAYAPTTITSVDYLKVGDEVIVEGYLLTEQQRTVCLMRDKSQRTGCRIIEINPTATAIRDIRTDAGGTDSWYDLQGRHVMNPKKGHLYLFKGKKVVK